MGSVPGIVLLAAAIGLAVLGVHGLRGLLDIREALRLLEFDRLSSPSCWPATRGLLAALAALPFLFLGWRLGVVGLLIALAVAGTTFHVAPEFLRAARRRVEEAVLDDLALHLDLLALALESGSSWPAALSMCVERAPDGPLRRAWGRVIQEIHAGAEPIEALRHLEQRARLAPLATLVSALRSAEKLQLPAAPVLRERARQAAAATFARGERAARAVPLKLWAAMVLCLAPCTAVVLAFPLAHLMARLLG
jgi:tight adherence protein C